MCECCCDKLEAADLMTMINRLREIADDVKDTFEEEGEELLEMSDDLKILLTKVCGEGGK